MVTRSVIRITPAERESAVDSNYYSNLDVNQLQNKISLSKPKSELLKKYILLKSSSSLNGYSNQRYDIFSKPVYLTEMFMTCIRICIKKFSVVAEDERIKNY